MKNAWFWLSAGLVGNGRADPPAIAGVAGGMSLVSLLRFLAVAEWRNSVETN
jgi:hypothetical protein